jgi:tRNA pseudouridine55 synthase
VIGVLNLDKPAGGPRTTVARVRRLAGERRVGHAGTLDPMATGVLGCAWVQPLAGGIPGRPAQGLSRRYSVCGDTDTWDAEGEMVFSADAGHLTLAAIEPALAAFRGVIEQVPPMYSALKRNGQPLYRLARQGVTIEREARTITISRLTVAAWQPPDLAVELTCSKGTYVRAIAHDLGVALGVGAHLAALSRTRIGTFTLDAALPAQVLVAGDGDALLAAVQPPAAVVGHLPGATIGEEAAALLRQGRPVTLPEAPAGDWLAALDGRGELVAVLAPGEEAGVWRPHKVMRPQIGNDAWRSPTAAPGSRRWRDGAHIGRLTASTAASAPATPGSGRAPPRPPQCAISFHPHPRAVLPQIAPPTNLPEERAAWWPPWVSICFIILPFTRELADLTAQAFGRQLCAGLHMRELWVGPDFAMARDREGDVPRLRQLAGECGYDLHVVEPLHDAAGPISSTRIRALLAGGQVAEAADLLGRPYSVSGEVIHGFARGRQLGFRTANIAPPPLSACCPPMASMPCGLRCRGASGGVANVASAHFDAGRRLIENPPPRL